MNLMQLTVVLDDKTAKDPSLAEQEILVQSVCETMVPKLVAEDIPLLFRFFDKKNKKFIHFIFTCGSRSTRGNEVI